MKTYTLLSILCLLLLAGCTSHSEPAHAGHSEQIASPYADETDRTTKAVSDDEIRALRTGQGMGLARAAELNGYPGPKHVLDLADQLDLTDAQLKEIQAQRATIEILAVQVGEDVIAAEQKLDALFASGEATHDRVDSLTATVAEARGQLRAAHLKMHLDAKNVLTTEQTATYSRLRGYTR